MRSTRLTNAVTYGLLATAAAVAVMLPAEIGPASAKADAQDSVETLTLTGVVRDFRAAHGDFELTLASGTGHYAGNIAINLSAAEKPAYAGGGFKVSTQWRTAATHTIAPHMFMNGAAARQVRMVSSPTISGNPTVDTFNSLLGPYGPGNIGAAPTWVTGAAMPAIVQPSGMPALVDEVKYSGNGTTTLSADVRCKKFTLETYRKLRISGNVRIVATELFKLSNNATIELLAGATLTVWTHKDVVFQNNVDVNVNTAAPGRFAIYHTGTGEFLVENSTRLYAVIQSPNAKMMVKNSANFYGTFTGKTMEIQNDCGVHFDAQGAAQVCGVELLDVAGAQGVNSSGGIGSAATFAQWFTDTLGINLSHSHAITMLRDSQGAWTHTDDTFFPIDGRLFGNEGQAHNYLFTYAVTTTFTHHACNARFVEFQGADDFWLFINGKLVLDIGGLVPNQLQRIDVDRLSLSDGQVYRIDFFYAQRQLSASRFHLRTNLDLSPSIASQTVSAGND